MDATRQNAQPDNAVPPSTADARTLFAGLELILLPSRAAFAPHLGALFTADIHLGKPAAFRAAGIPVPEHATDRDLKTLTSAIEQTRPAKLVILGDLVHSRQGLTPRTVDAVSRWRAAHEHITITLITGNHDRHAGALPAQWNIDQKPPGTELGPLTLTHDAQRDPVGNATLAGHTHPAVRLKSPGGRTATRLPAFIQSPNILTLPAFSAFTGTKLVRPTTRDRVFAIGDDAVVPLPAHAPRR